MDYSRYKTLLTERRGRVLTITMNRPQALNAVNAGFYPWPHGGYRFVTSWQTKPEDVARVVKAARG